jgi:hypothetical protein
LIHETEDLNHLLEVKEKELDHSYEEANSREYTRVLQYPIENKHQHYFFHEDIDEENQKKNI